MHFYCEKSSETLGEPECESMLDQVSIGRVGFVDAQGPMILPVNHTVAEGFIVFRTDSPTLLANAVAKRVSFEVDGWDGPTTAWSVVVRGHLQDVSVTAGPRFDALRTTHIATFAPGLHEHWLALEVDEITGRRVSIDIVATKS